MMRIFVVAALLSLVVMASGVASAPVFEDPVFYAVQSDPRAVAAADFDGKDGPDLAVVNELDGTVSVMLNNGDGTFGDTTNYVIGTLPLSVCAAEVTGDTCIDLVAGYMVEDGLIVTDSVCVLANNGDGTFTVRAGSFFIQDRVRCIVSADFDGVNGNDLAVAHFGGTDPMFDGVDVWLNDGSGGFTTRAHYNTAYMCWTVFAADLNNDGHIDLATANEDTLNYNVVILFNDGDGTFDNRVDSLSVGVGSHAIIAADLDGFPGLDLAVTNEGSKDVAILLNDSLGNFTIDGYYSVPGAPWDLFVADLDGDYDDDLAMTAGDSTVKVLVNGGAADFTGPFDYPVGDNEYSWPTSVVAADFDRDNYNDLATTVHNDDKVAVLINVPPPPPPPSFSGPVNYPVGDNPIGICAARLNDDCYYDLAVTNSYSGTVSILTGSGNGTFSLAGNYPAGTGPREVFSADLDGDGNKDLVAANRSADSISVLINAGNGVFLSPVQYPADDGPHTVVAADLDGDGDDDLAVANDHSGNVSVLFNYGTGVFGPPTNYPTGPDCSSVVATDVDGDGDYDLVAPNRTADNVSVLINTGAGVFTFDDNYSVGSEPYTVVSADLNGDTHNDLAVVCRYSNAVSVLLGDGLGGFGPFVNYPVGVLPYRLVAFDEDNDGDIDLAAPNRGSNNVSILRNNGNGTFAARVNFPAGLTPVGICSADFDGDSDNDLAVTNEDADNVSVLSNDLIVTTCVLRGDVDHCGTVNPLDLMYLAQFLWLGGPPPPFMDEADVDGVGGVVPMDAAYLINYLFRGGPPPVPCP